MASIQTQANKYGHIRSVVRITNQSDGSPTRKIGNESNDSGKGSATNMSDKIGKRVLRFIGIQFQSNAARLNIWANEYAAIGFLQALLIYVRFCLLRLQQIVFRSKKKSVSSTKVTTGVLQQWAANLAHQFTALKCSHKLNLKTEAAQLNRVENAAITKPVRRDNPRFPALFFAQPQTRTKLTRTLKASAKA